MKHIKIMYVYYKVVYIIIAYENKINREYKRNADREAVQKSHVNFHKFHKELINLLKNGNNIK